MFFTPIRLPYIISAFFTILVLALAIALRNSGAKIVPNIARSGTTSAFGKQVLSTPGVRSMGNMASTSASTDANANGNANVTKTPVYFLSHGGPNIMYETQHPVYPKIQQVGKEITEKVKPKAIVVFSAHWQAGRDFVQVNTAEETDLIYDFYGFPAHYYKKQFPHRGSFPIAARVLESLKSAGIKAEPVKRGLDHGVWASFSIAFDPKTNPLDIPIVQVSLFDTDDADQHYRLGQAVSALRSEGIQIIVSGMAVHNLRDMWAAMQKPSPQPYTLSFDAALKDAAEAEPEKRQAKLRELLERNDARKAHPSFEHILPVHVGAGAAEGEKGKRLYCQPEGSMSWSMFRWGDVPSA